MRTRSRVWLLAFLFVFCCTIFPSGRLIAQQATGVPVSTDAIDQLMAPIALYPDALVFQILTASTNVNTLLSFAGWMEKNAKLKGSEIQNAAQKAGFAAAYVALAPFPEVVKMMAQKSDWTKALGQAYIADQNGVFGSIQRLRAKAQQAGNLKTTSQQQVETQTTSSGTQVIVIQPANPEVIYVPVYNVQTVYVAAPPPPSPSGGEVAAAAAIGFTAGVIIGSAHNDYYHRADNYWDAREDYAEDRQDYAQDRQENARENQDQRQSSAQGNQDQRQSTAQANQGQRQSAASQSSGTRSGGGSGYQSGSATRAESSRGKASLSSSRGGGGGRRKK